MARTTMTKEVTHTTLKLVCLEMIDGLPKARELPDRLLMGNVTMQNAQIRMSKEFDFPVTVMKVIPETIKYVAEITDFIKIATPKDK